jgi:hypothetical protein
MVEMKAAAMWVTLLLTAVRPPPSTSQLVLHNTLTSGTLQAMCVCMQITAASYRGIEPEYYDTIGWFNAHLGKGKPPLALLIARGSPRT